MRRVYTGQPGTITHEPNSTRWEIGLLVADKILIQTKDNGSPDTGKEEVETGLKDLGSDTIRQAIEDRPGLSGCSGYPDPVFEVVGKVRSQLRVSQTILHRRLQISQFTAAIVTPATERVGDHGLVRE